MKILITGGAGYVGYSLVSELEKNEKVKEIVVFDNLSKTKNNFFLQGPKLLKTSFIKGDLLNLSVLGNKVNDFDVLVHLAAEVSFPFSNDDHLKYEQINQYGTLNLIRFLEDKNISKLIYLSSSSVYGSQENSSISSIPQPINAYGRSKLVGEQYFKLLEKTSDIYILRSANIFGYNPCMRIDAVMNQFFMDALLYNKIEIYGNGEQKRSFVYIKTVVSAIEECILGNRKQGLYNVLECNLSLNEIRDFLIDKNEQLEFTYIASSSNYQSITMKLQEEEGSNQTKGLEMFYNELKEQIRIK